MTSAVSTADSREDEEEAPGLEEGEEGEEEEQKEEEEEQGVTRTTISLTEAVRVPEGRTDVESREGKSRFRFVFTLMNIYM